MEQFSLDHVLFMPTYISPFKQNAEDVADGVHRLAMCRLAIAPYPCFSVSDYELQQKTVSYTIHTISSTFRMDSVASEIETSFGGGGCILCFIFSITDSFAIEIPLLSFAVFFLFRPLIQLMEYNIFYYVFR